MGSGIVNSNQIVSTDHYLFNHRYFRYLFLAHYFTLVISYTDNCPHLKYVSNIGKCCYFKLHVVHKIKHLRKEGTLFQPRVTINPKRAGLFWPISQPRGGGRIPPPLKISGTDRWNIKCVVLVDSYDPPEFIGIKKIQNIPCMTSQWRH